RVEEMKRKGDAYFSDRAGQSRQLDEKDAERKQSYDAIIQTMQSTKASFWEFLDIINEIKSLLEGERNPAAMARAKDLFSKANCNCIEVQQGLMHVEQELDRAGARFEKME